MTKAEALKQFREEVKPYLTPGDKPMLAEAWNNYTDALCKEGKITMKQYETWTHAGV